MIKRTHVCFAAFLALFGFYAIPASAGSTAYLSHAGTSTTCILADPCGNISFALTVAGTNGEVICLDKGSYFGASISQAVTISCGDGLWESTIGFSINTPAGADVVIEGLVFDERGSTASGLTFSGQGALHLRRVRVGNSSAAAVSHGLDFRPNGPATLDVSDSVFYGNGAVSGTAVSAAINIRPASGATVGVAIERTVFNRNKFGIIADGTGGGIIRGIVSDSVFTNNINNAVTVATTSSSVVLTIDNTKVTGNAFGLVAAGGPNAGMLVRRSVINSNATGLNTSSGAALYSYRDNSVNGNTTTDGAFTGTIGTQ